MNLIIPREVKGGELNQVGVVANGIPEIKWCQKDIVHKGPKKKNVHLKFGVVAHGVHEEIIFFRKQMTHDTYRRHMCVKRDLVSVKRDLVPQETHGRLPVRGRVW